MFLNHQPVDSCWQKSVAFGCTVIYQCSTYLAVRPSHYPKLRLSSSHSGHSGPFIKSRSTWPNQNSNVPHKTTQCYSMFSPAKISNFKHQLLQKNPQPNKKIKPTGLSMIFPPFFFCQKRSVKAPWTRLRPPASSAPRPCAPPRPAPGCSGRWGAPAAPGRAGAAPGGRPGRGCWSCSLWGRHPEFPIKNGYVGLPSLEKSMVFPGVALDANQTTELELVIMLEANLLVKETQFCPTNQKISQTKNPKTLKNDFKSDFHHLPPTLWTWAVRVRQRRGGLLLGHPGRRVVRGVLVAVGALGAPSGAGPQLPAVLQDLGGLGNQFVLFGRWHHHVITILKGSLKVLTSDYTESCRAVLKHRCLTAEMFCSADPGLQSFIFEGSLAEKLRFGASKLHFLNLIHWISHWMTCQSIEPQTTWISKQLNLKFEFEIIWNSHHLNLKSLEH